MIDMTTRTNNTSPLYFMSAKAACMCQCVHYLFFFLHVLSHPTFGHDSLVHMFAFTSINVSQHYDNLKWKFFFRLVKKIKLNFLSPPLI